MDMQEEMIEFILQCILIIKNNIMRNVSFGYEINEVKSYFSINGIDAYKFSVTPFEIFSKYSNILSSNFAPAEIIISGFCLKV